jgi:hypothetical protein
MDLAFIASFGSLFKMFKFLWAWALDNSTAKRVYGVLLAMQIFLNFTV